jgi:flagellar FliL protein
MIMTDTVADPPKPRRGALLPILAGLILALLLGGGGFYATWSGLVLAGDGAQGESAPEALPDVAFLPLDPVVVALNNSADGRHLRFAAQLEVAAPHAAEVDHLRPRILDVLNGYLRAVDPAALQQAGALLQIRAQLLRRIQIVTGEGRVRDLLVTEFILG